MNNERIEPRRGGAAAPSRTRRSPDPAERQRDAERTKQRILDAALAEFADKGYAGARVRGIAERAGVNSQLISYYFGGKQALYSEVVLRWHAREAEIEAQDLSLPDLAVAYFETLFEQPELNRMFIWEGLSPSAPRASLDLPEGEAPEVTDLRRRQEAGELTPDIDPAYLMIAIMGALNTPITMPHMIERLCGVPAFSDEFRETFAEQIRTILRRLRPDHPPA